MRRVQAGYEKCADDYQVRIQSLNKNGNGGPVDSNSEENVQMLCCSFQKYLHCSERVVNTTCGHETARFTKSFLDRMSGPLIQGHCQEHGSSAAQCMDIMAIENGGVRHPVPTNNNNNHGHHNMNGNNNVHGGRRPDSYPYSAAAGGNEVSSAGNLNASLLAMLAAAVVGRFLAA